MLYDYIKTNGQINNNISIVFYICSIVMFVLTLLKKNLILKNNIVLCNLMILE